MFACVFSRQQATVQTNLDGSNQHLLAAAQKQQLFEEQLHLAAPERADRNAETLSVIEAFSVKGTVDYFREYFCLGRDASVIFCDSLKHSAAG